MIYLEKIEVTEEAVKYYYYPWEGAEKGIVIYFPKTGLCRTEVLCEDDGAIYYGSRRDNFAKYNPKTQEYIIVKDDYIKSFYKITQKQFEEYKKQEGYEEWKE